jgi:hypothetical protein
MKNNVNTLWNLAIFRFSLVGGDWWAIGTFVKFLVEIDNKRLQICMKIVLLKRSTLLKLYVENLSQ